VVDDDALSPLGTPESLGAVEPHATKPAMAKITAPETIMRGEIFRTSKIIIAILPYEWKQLIFAVT
jgi:hypothetical protein